MFRLVNNLELNNNTFTMHSLKNYLLSVTDVLALCTEHLLNSVAPRAQQPRHGEHFCRPEGQAYKTLKIDDVISPRAQSLWFLK